MTRTYLLIALLLLPAGQAAGPPALPPGVPGTPLPKVRTRTDFPPGLGDLAGPLGALDSLNRAAFQPPEGNLTQRFNTGPTATLHRWEWLTVGRRNLEYYDDLARQAVIHEREFWKLFNATNHPRKESFRDGGREFQHFYYQRIIQREGWYYTAGFHHWRWEKDRPGGPINARIVRRVCKAVGCDGRDLRRALAWMDLFATELLPEHTSQFLTVPFSLMS